MTQPKYCFASSVLIAAATLSLTAQTVFDTVPSRIVGQAILQQTGAITAIAPNLVEGRELWNPEQMALDTSVTPPILYVADALNNRVLAWKNASGFQKGDFADLIVGQRDKYTTLPQGPSANGLSAGLNTPTGVAVDSHGNLYVADTGNNRVLRYPAPFQQSGQLLSIDLVLGQKDTSGATKNQGLQSASATTLSLAGQISFLGFDPSGNLWVGDANNNRLLRFSASALGSNPAFDPPANMVLGEPDYSTTTPPNPFSIATKTAMLAPNGFAFDTAGNLYVTDSASRLLVYIQPFTGGQSAARIAGITPATTSNPNPPVISAGTLGYPQTPGGNRVPPQGVFFLGGNIFVLDTGASRIVEYPALNQWPLENPANGVYGPAAISVFGQPDFQSYLPNQGQPQPADNTFSFPAAAVVAGTDVLVSDSGNNRVLAFPVVNNLLLHANRILGQLDFKYNSLNLIEGREFELTNGQGGAGGGTAVDLASSTPHLYIADVFNHRVLGYKDARTVTAGQTADLVIGEPDFYTAVRNYPTGSVSQPTSTGLYLPESVAVDANGDLWVADSGNGRVLRFPQPFKQPQTALQQANLVIGQAGFTVKVTDASSATMSSPYGIAFTSAGHLLVSDATLDRVLLFTKPSGGDFVNGQGAAAVIGEPDFITSSTNELYSPRGIATDSSDRLYVADTQHNRVVIYANVTISGNDPAPRLALTGAAAGDSFNGPEGLTVDPVSGEVWVADTFNNRMVRFPHFDTLVLTQTNNLTFAEISPISIALDSFGDPIVAEASANRVAFFYRAIGPSGNAANYFQRYAPGMLATLFPSQNSSFGSTTANFSGLPIGTTLGGVEVLVGGTPAPLLYVSPSQINFQIPSATPVGSSPVEIDVVNTASGQILATNLYRIDPYSPGLFTVNASGQGQLAALNQDNTLNSSSNPAKAGTVIQMFATGEGVVPGGPPDGQAAPGALSTPIVPRVFINAVETSVEYSGLAPGYVGLWQINAVIPNSVPVGSVNVVILMDDFDSSLDPVSGKFFFGTIAVHP